MDASSPVKRRVLGALDPNACSPNKARKHEGGKQQQQQLFTPPRWQTPVKATPFVPPRRELTVGGTLPANRVLSTSLSPPRSPSPPSSQSLVPDTPVRETGTDSRKRRSPSSSAIVDTPTSGIIATETEVAEGGEPAAKRACLDSRREDGQVRRSESPPPSTLTTRTVGTTRHRSASPDAPSVFDNSVVENSQATVLTEPDAAGPNSAPVPASASLPAPLPTPRGRPRLTREQAREKAEILRLRLGLASYKVRTGQTDVPLDRLEARVAGAAAAHARRSASFSFHGQSESRGHSAHHAPTTSLSASSPPPASTAIAVTTAQREHRRPLPSAPVRRASDGTERGRYVPPPPAPPSRSQFPGEARLTPAGEIEQRQGRGRYHQDRYNHHQQHRDSHTSSHQRHHSEAVLDTRHHPGWNGHASNPADRRPRTANDVPGSSLPSSSSSCRRRAVSFAGSSESLRREERTAENGRRAEYEEDMDSRGGAASWLLSLARS
ncbi:hypothetical protein VTH82DRAFT_649 [Thermothelomyces myriococcoides]